MRINLSVLLLFFVFSLQAQDSETLLVIWDQNKGAPIPDANIYVMNSSYGAESDAKGIVRLSTQKVSGQELIITHIGYALTNYTVELSSSSIDTVFLTAQAVTLDNVTVTSKKSSKRKKWLERFEKDLFGKYKRKKQIKLLNPEVIIFEEKNDTLYAYANDLLRFENKYLSYDLLFYLKSYQRDKDDLFYKGSGFFKELDQSSKAKKKALKAQQKEWYGSSQHFFHSLLIDDKNDFEVYLRNIIDGEESFENVGNIKNLVLGTNQDNVFCLIGKKTLYIKKGNNVSLIIPKNGLILFDHKGKLLNLREVDIEGHWAKASITQLLPAEYIPTKEEQKSVVRPNQIYALSELRSIANEYDTQGSQDFLVEKIDLTTDRLIYQNGEQILVKGNVINLSTNKLINDQQLVHVELIDERGQIVDYKLKQIENGTFETGFKLTDQLIQGQYVIRAYTDYMTNFDHSYFGHKTIGLGLVKLQQDWAGSTSDFNANLFIEGNGYVSNSSNRMVIVFKNKLDELVSFSGSITFNKEAPIKIKTNVPGMAILSREGQSIQSIQILDESGKEVTLETNDQLFEQPNALTVLSRSSDYYTLFIRSNESIKGTVDIFAAGKKVYELADVKEGETYRIAKSFFPENIIEFRLFNEEGELISLRSIDNRSFKELDLVSINQDYQFYYSRQKAKIQFQGLESFNEEASNEWKVIVSAKDYSDNAKSANDFNFRSDLSLLSATNKEYLSNFFRIRYDDKKLNDLKKIMRMDKDLIAKVKYQSISGQLFDKKKEKVINGTVTFSVLNENFFYAQTITDENGRFVYDSIPYFPNSNIIIQARKGISQEGELSELDRNVFINIDTFERIIPEINLSKFKRKDLVASRVIKEMATLKQPDISNQPFDLEQVAPEVTIKARKRNLTMEMRGWTDLAKADYIAPRTRVERLATLLNPTVVLRKARDNSAFTNTPFESRVMDPYTGEFIWIPYVVVINGERQMTAARYENLIADQIRFVSSSKAGLVIITNPNNRFRSKIEALNYGIMNYAFIENIEDVTFKNIDPDKDLRIGERDDRKTLAWKNISDAVAPVEFYTSDHEGTYLIQLEKQHSLYGPLKFTKEIEVEPIEKE